MIRSVLTVSSGTLASRLLGFARDALAAALLGAGPVADAFLMAFQLINVIRRMLGEGALNAALVPAWMRVRDSNGLLAASAFAGAVLGTVSASPDRAGRDRRRGHAAGHHGARAGLCRPREPAACGHQCAADAALSRFRGAGHGDDGLAQCAASFRDNRLLAAAVQHRPDPRNPDAAPVA